MVSSEDTKAQVKPVSKPRGRPRSFDRETALEKALLAFWKHGYEATSVSDLTRVMDIGAPSLYAAFGDKRSLFEEVVREYGAKYGSFGDRALADEPTARAAVERTLREAAVEYTVPGRPPGCMAVSTTGSTTESSEEAAALLRAKRVGNVRLFQDRIEADMAAGVLPAETDAAALARFNAAVLQGMSQQAKDGADRDELAAVAEAAMRAWPA
jgi:TetR/AcrR family transcriptional regulator, copper-responsive repressor